LPQRGPYEASEGIYRGHGQQKLGIGKELLQEVKRMTSKVVVGIPACASDRVDAEVSGQLRMPPDWNSYFSGFQAASIY